MSQGELTHYIPRSVLKEFQDGSLYEYDKLTNECEKRGVRVAGQYEGFYSPHIEHGPIGKWDNVAHKIYPRFRDQGIELSTSERADIATWLGLYLVRCPFNRDSILGHIRETTKQVDEIANLVRARAAPYLEQVKEEKRFLYWQLRELLGGNYVHQYIIHYMTEQVRTYPERHVPSDQDAFDIHIASRSFEEFGTFLVKMAWTWLHCPTGLVIGDNPLCRWHVPTGTPNYGINRDEVEVTVPLTRKICLLLRKPRTGVIDGDNVECNEERAFELNRRQIASATRKVFGPYRWLLKPETEYGFG